jgi:hypothetical protein
MNAPLRPMNLGEILDRTAQMYRSRLLLFVGVALVPAIAALVCFAAGFLLVMLSRNGTGGAIGAGFGFLILVLIGLPLYALCTGLGYAALCTAARRQYFGEPVTVREAYREARAHLWRYTSLFTIEMGILGVIPFAVIVAATIGAGVVIAATGASKDISGAIVGFAMFGLLALWFAFALWMLPRLSLAFPACVVEQTGVSKSLKRGFALSRGTRWRILLLFVLGAVLGWMASWITSLPAVLLIALIPALKGSQNAQLVGTITLFVMYGASFAVQALIKPVYGIGLTLFYYDQRIRKEGFDIEWMMQQAGLSAPAQESAAVAGAGFAGPIAPVPIELGRVVPGGAESGQT